MIRKNIYKILCALVLASLMSCHYNEPQAPNPAKEQNEWAKLTPTHTVAQLKALYKGGATTINEEVIVQAIMASDDSEGNLYKTCYIEDETGGLELKFAMGNLSTLFPQGSKVVLLAKGLTLGKYGEQVGLGYRSLEAKYETAFLPEKLVQAHLKFVALGELQPKKVNLKDINKSMAGTLIKLDNVQFKQSELGQTYADPVNKNLKAVNRFIVDKDGNEIITRTSCYAKFAGHKVAQGSGSIVAILSYFVDTPQLYILKVKDVQMNNDRFTITKK